LVVEETGADFWHLVVGWVELGWVGVGFDDGAFTDVTAGLVGVLDFVESFADFEELFFVFDDGGDGIVDAVDDVVHRVLVDDAAFGAFDEKLDGLEVSTPGRFLT
jgi:hypothetical protein